MFLAGGISKYFINLQYSRFVLYLYLFTSYFIRPVFCLSFCLLAPLLSFSSPFPPWPLVPRVSVCVRAPLSISYRPFVRLSFCRLSVCRSVCLSCDLSFNKSVVFLQGLFLCRWRAVRVSDRLDSYFGIQKGKGGLLAV